MATWVRKVREPGGWLPLLFLLLGGCGDWRSPRALVAIDGSSTVYPITEAIAEEFHRERSRTMVTVGRSGTGGGFNRFCRGETDISAASRRILPGEARDCSERGIRYLELPVAVDGVSVIVSHENEFTDCLTVQDLRAIWRSGSRVRTWRDVRPEFPGAEIQLYGPGTDSGTYDFFTETIVGEVGASRTDFQASEDDNVLVQGITGDRHALGFFGFAYLARNRERLGVVAVDGGGGCVRPTLQTIRDGSYAPLTRRLFLYVKRSSLQRGGVRDFLQFYMNRAGEVIPETGFLPVSDSVYQANLEVLGRASRIPDGSDSADDGRMDVHG
jgi:phosphate transport system substrate-binding protein